MNLYLAITNYLSIYYIKRSIRECGLWHTYHTLRFQGAPKSTALWGMWVAINTK
jgi:hypothetical protein